MPKTPSPKKMRSFQQTVWKYYRAHGRNMPWRHTHNPYHILVSEIMLQQTQVSRVTIKYPEFIKAFPTISSLARAPLRTVLQTWQGMGYNRRALSLKITADIIVKKYYCRIPRDPAVLATLPGIGHATAGSIAAFAFNTPTTFIETNIRRVFIHHFFSQTRQVRDEHILPLVSQSVDQKNPRKWYWALMDYGSYLVKQIPNPNHKSKIYKKQKPFEGSHRQLRGILLTTLLKKQHTIEDIVAATQQPCVRIKTILTQLIKEGILTKKKTSYSISTSYDNRTITKRTHSAS